MSGVDRASPIGRLLKAYRARRRLSQLQLAQLADVSARHLSFVETGRAEPSRELVLRLANALDVPLADRNALLLAAGYAPLHQTRALDAAAMAPVRRVLERILSKHEPYPAVAIDRLGVMVQANDALLTLLRFLGLRPPDAGAPGARPAMNLFMAVFDQAGLRPYIEDWENAARAALRRLSREAEALGGDRAILQLIRQIEQLPGVPADWHRVAPFDESLPCQSFALVRGGERLAWFSTITLFGTPQDVTLQGLQIESFFPADDATERRWAELRATAQSEARLDRAPASPSQGL